MYVQLYQVHGLIRSRFLELGRNEDTGGQIVYVYELAKALAANPAVSKVEIVTRLFDDAIYPGYSKPFEHINEKLAIVRIPCGPSKYLKKIDLWNYLDEFVRNLEYYITTDERKPDIIHSNYCDAGYVCNLLSDKLDIPHVFSAHSLGKPKYEELKSNYFNIENLNDLYKFNKRFETEEETIKNADAILLNCPQEKKDQFSLYDIDLDDARLKIIPPGVNTNRFKPFWKQNEETSDVKKLLHKKISSNLKNPLKPSIFMLSRLEAKKNISNMVECYLFDNDLQESVNLIICAGNLVDRSLLNLQQLSIIYNIEKLIKMQGAEDKVYLFDKVDYETEVPILFEIIAENGGVFVDCDITDPLSFAVIEAAACGLPVIAHNSCALLEVTEQEDSELLINIKKHLLLSSRIIKLIKNKSLWNYYSYRLTDYIQENLTWNIMADKVFKVYQGCLD